MMIYWIAAILVSVGVIYFFIWKNERESKLSFLDSNHPAVQSAPPVTPYNGPGLSEEELAVIAATIKAFENEAFEITSVHEVERNDYNLKKDPAVELRQARQSLWTQAARRAYQKRL